MSVPIVPGPDPDQPQYLPPIPPPAHQQPQPIVVRPGYSNNGTNAAGITITVIVVVFVGIPLLGCVAFMAMGLLGR